MIICVCHRVSDKQIKVAAEQGATSLRELRNHCTFGSQCGQCCSHARELLKECHSEPVFLEAKIA